MNLKPLGNKVHLKPNPLPNITRSGLILPELDPKDCRTFHVLAVGPKVKEIEPGDNVLAPLYFDSMTLDDGTKITDAKQVAMVVRLG